MILSLFFSHVPQIVLQPFKTLTLCLLFHSEPALKSLLFSMFPLPSFKIGKFNSPVTPGVHVLRKTTTTGKTWNKERMADTEGTCNTAEPQSPAVSRIGTARRRKLAVLSPVQKAPPLYRMSTP